MTRTNANWVIIAACFLTPLAAYGSEVKMPAAKSAKLKIETAHYGAPGSPADVTSEAVPVVAGKEFRLTSVRFKTQHRMKVLALSENSIEIQPADESSIGLLKHLKKTGDKSGFSIPGPQKEMWTQTIRRGETLLLIQPGIADAGAQWSLSLEN